MAISKDDLLNAIAEMSVMEVVELVSAMEEKFGVSAAAAVAVAAPAGGGDAGGGAAEEKDDGVPFAEKMATLTAKLSEQFAESARLEEEIKKNLAGLGYEL